MYLTSMVCSSGFRKHLRGEGLADRLVADAHVGDEQRCGRRAPCANEPSGPSQSGRNCGYFSMSATSANILSGVWLTRRVVSNCGMRAVRYSRFFSCASRAARSLAKSSPAWCDERVSGLDATSRKPLA